MLALTPVKGSIMTMDFPKLNSLADSGGSKSYILLFELIFIAYRLKSKFLKEYKKWNKK